MNYVGPPFPGSPAGDSVKVEETAGPQKPTSQKTVLVGSLVAFEGRRGITSGNSRGSWAAGGVVVARALERRSPDPATFIGKGK